MPVLGRPSNDPDEQALVDRLAEAVAAAYVALTPSLKADASGVLMMVYWDGCDVSHWVAPGYVVHGEPPDWEPDFGEDTETVRWPDVLEDPTLREPGEALLALVNDRKAYELVGRYYRALSDRLSAAWGVPVVAEDPDAGITGQQAPPTATKREPSPPPVEGVLLEIPRGNGIVAGLRAEGDRHLVATDLTSRYRSAVIGDGIALTGDADVTAVGGRLPEGAVAARVQDLFDAWHDAAVADGWWVALLPHPARGGVPPVVFLDGDGAEVEPPVPEPRERADTVWASYSVGDVASDFDPAAWQRELLRDARVPVLWDDALGTDPEPSGGEDRIELLAGDTSVDVADGGEWSIDDPEREARDLLEQHLWHRAGRRAAGRAAIEATPRPLPATIDGHDQTFLLLEGGGAWVAVWADARTRIDIRVRGTGPAPERLDLRRFGG